MFFAVQRERDANQVMKFVITNLVKNISKEMMVINTVLGVMKEFL